MDDKTRRKRSYAAGCLLSLAGKPLPLSTKRVAASEPIPVGSEPEKPTTFTPDPISMTMGWLVGRRIAGQRSDVPVVSDYIVTFENGVLYIQKAPAVMSNGILEVT